MLFPILYTKSKKNVPYLFMSKYCALCLFDIFGHDGKNDQLQMVHNYIRRPRASKEGVFSFLERQGHIMRVETVAGHKHFFYYTLYL